MQTTEVNGVKLAYEAKGSGEPLLLISPVLADGFLPFSSEPALADRYHLIRYHKRGWGGSTHSPAPVSVADHAADAAALLDHLGVPRAHIAGHSSGGAVALQLAQDRPEKVQSLVLLEPSILSVPGAGTFLQKAGPALEAYAAGNAKQALEIFMRVVSGLDWDACRTLLEERIPGSVQDTLKDADTFFGVELPGLTRWSFDATSAGALNQPVLSVLGSETEPLWVEIAGLLRSWIRGAEECKVAGVGHLLHIQRPEPIARGIAEFLGRHPLAAA
jgi:3-oxoadipate enol-lactonase